MLLYIKYGELTLKGKNKKLFINCLYKNIKSSLSNFKNIEIAKKFDHMMISSKTSDNEEEIIGILKRVSGISNIIKCYTCKSNLKDIYQCIKDNLNFSSGTFKVVTKRIDKTFPSQSNKINCDIGGMVLDDYKDLKVDIHKPDHIINIEVKKPNSYIYFDKIKGCGGFPLGINGKVLVLISGGIDSPVAASLLIKKGFTVDFLTFTTPPHTNPKSLEKVKKLVKILTTNLYKPKLYICNFTNLQNELAHMSIKSYQITLMRRFFFRIARDLARKYKYDAIATGESLGQVASQTIESMNTIQNAASDIVILRPLLTYDKNEIIDIAIKIGTYETSIEPYIDCCALFVPKNPATKPTIHTAEMLEKELDLAFGIYEKIIDKIEIFEE